MRELKVMKTDQKVVHFDVEEMPGEVSGKGLCGVHGDKKHLLTTNYNKVTCVACALENVRIFIIERSGRCTQLREDIQGIQNTHSAQQLVAEDGNYMIQDCLRELSMAITKLDEAQMWLEAGIKGITPPE